jgi:hypothetical protein
MVLLVARSRGALRTATTGPENERADAQPTTATAAIEQAHRQITSVASWCPGSAACAFTVVPVNTMTAPKSATVRRCRLKTRVRAANTSTTREY